MKPLFHKRMEIIINNVRKRYMRLSKIAEYVLDNNPDCCVRCMV